MTSNRVLSQKTEDTARDGVDLAQTVGTPVDHGIGEGITSSRMSGRERPPGRKRGRRDRSGWLIAEW